MKDAITMAKMGLRVMPVHGLAWTNDKLTCTCGKRDCKSAGKHPIFNKWQNIFENDIPTITAWFSKYQWANVAVITGQASQIVVLDIDPKNGGNASLLAAQERYGDLPDTPTVTTGSGGAHYYFKHPGGKLANRTNCLGAGVDFRGDGGFVVAPHSGHISGQCYEWDVAPQDMPFADMPPWLFREIQKPTSTPVHGGAKVTASGALVSEGGRNAWLASMAGTLRRRGLSYRPIMAALWYANIDHCEPPLAPEDVRTIARSICRYGWTP